MTEETTITVECVACKGTGKISGEKCPGCDGIGYVQQSSVKAVCPQCGYDGGGADSLLTANIQVFESEMPIPLACQSCGWVNPIELIDEHQIIVWSAMIGRRWHRNPGMRLFAE